ncbi:uncharacterized protein LOC119598536 [Penaeus monodon]|uniref:uncharacterized protein LOC119598536 n=1 Tax=Penaeus monodon TaxID=6687 RepID=UPI0018A7A6DA|nr:uncharacterized protein LOC119598536 [Penaeus monodon]XP_037804091.1 uncharacterized protein LOC119598536 [Penaeus monodon]XP_037804092.1 uncharacterized protein LOC119598536 [Penaeus monodon]XP_037804094.1 uncharacterized protein LOC119598536 [Penaeus monodon]
MRQKADDARRGSTDGRQEKSVKLPRRMSASVAKQETRWGMSKETRSGLKVTALWITYLLLGSVAFIYLEQTSTTTATPKDHHHWARFKELASAGDALEELLELRLHILQLCPHPVINGTFGLLESKGERESHGQAPGSAAHQDKLGLGADWPSAVEEECQESLRIIDHVTEVEKWTLVDSIYFTMTAVTTIGYGHISPATRYGRLFCVLYSLVGVPLTCILMAYSSEMLSNRMLQLYTSARKRHQRHRKTLLYGITWIYLSVGFIVFMFLPSLALSKLEDWSYEDALYYTFITLSTIGFGDLVAGYRKDQPYSEVYKLAIVVWIMMALGYWFLLLNFLQKALKSNVPRRIKKTLRSKRIAKQAEFFRQLVGRVKLGQRKASLVDGDRGVVALMVEVAGAFVGDEPGRTSRKQSLRIDCTQGHDDSDSEANEPLTLSDLLDVNVVLRSDSMPAIRNLVAQTGTPAEEYSQSLHGIMTGAAEGEGQAGDAEGGQAAESFPDEVVLPLREVLHLVSLVASVEEQVHNTAEDDDATACSSTTLQEDPNASPADSTPSIVTFDPRENVPLLRDIFHCKHSHPAKSGYCNGIKMKSRMRTLSQREEEEIDEVLNEVFDVSTDAEEDEEEEDTEGDNESQLEDDEDEDEGEGERTRRLGDGPKTLQDVEAGNYCMRGKIGCVHKR